MVNTPAFDLIRQFKEVDSDTESLVLKRVRNKITQTEMMEAFEKGVAGDYGKFYTADPQTLITWVNKYLSGKDSAKNYLQSGLVDKRTHVTHPNYPDDFQKEANKCFTAFVNGVSPLEFHPHVYDRLMVDNKIPMNCYLKYFEPTGNESEDVMIAKQKVLKDFFTYCKKKGWTYLYMITEKTK